MSFESPVSGVSLMPTWQEGWPARFKQLLILPLALIAYLFLILMIPIIFFLGLCSFIQQYRNLRGELATLKKHDADCVMPKIKTIEHLWDLHGLGDFGASNDEEIQLLTDWLPVLYGEEVAARFNLEQALSDMMTRRVEANLPFYDGQDDAPHIHFAPPLDSLIRWLAEELPEY